MKKFISDKILCVWRAMVWCAVATAVHSCADEPILPAGADVIPEGETEVTAEVRFSPMIEALTGDDGKSRSNGMEFEGEGDGESTVAPKGDAMGQLSSLYILFYDTEGNLCDDIEPMEVDLEAHKPVYENREPADATNGVPAESRTLCVKFPFMLPFGDYRVYAVANMDDLLTAHAEDIKTVTGLRDIKLEWSDRMSGNCEMLGYFTTEKADTRGMNFETDNVVKIRPGMRLLHAWIRRAVSKLTIDFDGTGLRDNVYVYIKEARVYDIADGCYLGHYSCVGKPADDRRDEVSGGFGLTQSSHVLMYGRGEDFHNWPVVVKDAHLSTYEHEGKEVNYHDEEAYCLPFYENMQGPGMMKYQDADSDGKVDFPEAGDYEVDENGDQLLNPDGSRKWMYQEAKDSKPNGTYVEVTGYYESNNDNYVSKGPIKFRFMLGKNVADNYDCERNHHYKLTLRFHGNGNDADWHIEYDDAEGIHLPNPLYISYLYNHTTNLPIRINTGGRKIKEIRADIISNNWAPDIPGYDQLDPKDRLDYYRDVDKAGGFGTKYPWHGFLSLVKTTHKVIEGADLDNGNRLYYEKSLWDGDFNISRGHRSYLATSGEHGSDETGKYTVTRSRNVVNAVLPIYTRAKQMIVTSGYTGNNPYVGYERKAVVQVSVVFEGGRPEDALPVATTEVYQVRRIENPKGIFRSHDNTDPFHVKLMTLERESAYNFDEIKSHGPWRAYIVRGNKDGFINIDGGTETSGATRTPIEFDVNFTSTCREDESRFAIIRVEYHNYSCVHLIFVRQGEAPVKMYDSAGNEDVYWHTYNMLTGNSVTDNPVDEGSLFRFNKLEYPIDASNNRYTKQSIWAVGTAGDFKTSLKNEYYIAGTNNPKVYKGWNEIGSGSSSDTIAALSTAADIKSLVPTADDFMMLRNSTEQGYGVLYGDGALTVADNIDDAYGYQRDSDGQVNRSRGMRGCFVYVADEKSDYSGRNLFFPIGASGYGHRKEIGKRSSWGVAEIASGILRYASGRVDYYETDKSPLFYDLFRRQGATYWGRKIIKDNFNNQNLGLDINYFTFDFNQLGQTSMWGNWTSGGAITKDNSDACYIRCVDYRRKE